MWRWLPDADPTTPEIYTDMSGMYPTSDGGYATIPVSSGSSQLGGTSWQTSATAFGGFVRYLDGTAKLIWNASATGNKIYENTTDVTGTAATMRAVAMYGNVCIITQGRSLNVKAKTGTGGTFADLAGSPPDSDFIVSNNLAVMLLSYNDGTDTPDGWWASDIGDHTTWTPASTNQAANGRLTQAPGPIRGAIAFKDAIYAFKDSAIFVGRYVGRPTIWQWQMVRSDIGCSHQEAILTDGDSLYFFGRGGAWKTDGYGFSRIDDDLSAFLYGEYALKVITAGVSVTGMYDSVTGCVLWQLIGGPLYIYNTKTGLWSNAGSSTGITGKSASRFPYPFSRMTAHDAGVLNSSSSKPCWPFASASDGKVYLLDKTNSDGADPITSYVTTGLIGNYRGMTTVRRVTPILVGNPTTDPGYSDASSATFTLTPYSADSSTEVVTTGSDVSSSTDLKRFDLMKSARFHKFKIFNSTHSFRIIGVDIDAKPAGTD